MVGKVIGLDYGSKTCGVAVSDALGMFAHPVATLYYSASIDELKEPLQEIITKERVKKIALGYPKMMNNDIGERAQLSEDFKQTLETWFDVEVTLIDERLTSVAAHRILIDQDVSRKKRKKVVDQLAAVQILQSFLDRQRFLEGN
ncbi:Holliday junction resolvase RuvX [Erysipelothrix sp. HDW6C]|uniref:Holliday junction resolvase RuvX n=1 Tax=Erysipelothrix sp. HDW6C TaxID=2714930 RepID=UPI00140CDED6|nr:Holliday junction resolvase RuvX [Erysipelothrix sp. HDW6C]QIK70455.1 Holliday junction resolvase RuvX [Erysipelothrix sp. HDW6C]